eukprot:876987_1
MALQWMIRSPLHMIKSILNNYPTDAEKMKLLTTRDKHTSTNVFDYLYTTPQEIGSLNHDRLEDKTFGVFGYLLSFIKQKDDYKVLIRPAEDGKTFLYRVGKTLDNVKGSLTLDKLKSIPISNALVSLKTDANQCVIGGALEYQDTQEDYYLNRCTMAMIFCNKLNTTDWISLIMDEFSQGIFGYVHDHENEFMPKLLHLRHKDTHDTLLMRFFRSVNASKNLFMFAWIVSWIKKLDPSEIVSFVTATNLIGDTAFHLLQCVGTKMKKETNKQKDNRNTKYAKDLLMLLPTQAIKEKAILQPNHRGMTAFMSVLRGEYSTGSAYIMWNNIQNTETKLRLMNRNCDLEENVENDNWKDWCKQALRVQTNPLRIDDVELLAPSFYYALKRGDPSFARAIVNKINTNSHRKIIAFLSTKLKDECALHFASHCSNSYTLQVLFELMNELTNEEMTKLLLDREVMCSKDGKTPFIVACEQNNYALIQYLLSRIETESDKLRVMQMEAVNGANAIWIACSKWENVECLKALLSSISSKAGVESIMNYTNSKNESIYHYVNSLEICECIKAWNTEAVFGFNEFHAVDGDGATAFLKILKHDSAPHCRNTLIEWILNTQCQSDEERAQLILTCDHNGQHSLDLAKDASTILLLQSAITNIISSNSKAYNSQPQTIFALFLWSLSKGKLVVTKWLLAQLNESSRRKMMNKSNQVGMNAVLCSCKAAQIASLQFLLSHPYLDQQLVYSADNNGNNAIHYSCGKDSQASVACFRTILELYKTKISKYSDLLIQNRIFDHAMPHNTDSISGARTNGYHCSKTQEWSVGCVLDDNVNLMRLLFKEDQNGRIALIEHGINSNIFSKKVAYWISGYFEDIDEISDLDCKYAGYALLYLGAECWHIHKLIVSKCKDEVQLFEVLNTRSGEGYSVLDRVCKSEKWCVVEWYLSDIIPDNHPILVACNTFTNETCLMYLLERGAIQFADKLISKIDDKKERLNLIEKKDYKNQSILDSAVCKDIPSQVEWIRHQIEN